MRLYCGAAEALPVALSSTETQTPAAFTVTDLCQSLMSALLPSPWPQRHNISTNHSEYKKDRNNSLLFTCFYYLTGEEKLFDIRGQKTSCSGLGTLGCLTDWLHGQSSQGLSLCPTAFQTAPGLREFCLGQKNDKLELHFTKSECLGWTRKVQEWNEIAFYHLESKDNGVDVNVFVLWKSNHMNMQNKRHGFPLLCWCSW